MKRAKIVQNPTVASRYVFHASSLKLNGFALPATRHTIITYPRRKLRFLSIAPHLSFLSCRTFSQQILSIHTPCDTPVGKHFHRHFHTQYFPVCHLQARTVQNIEELITKCGQVRSASWGIRFQKRLITTYDNTKYNKLR